MLKDRHKSMEETLQVIEEESSKIIEQVYLKENVIEELMEEIRQLRSNTNA